jgi:hypothetical protein
MYASAQSLDLTRGINAPRPKGQPAAVQFRNACEIALDLANPAAAGLDWKLTPVPFIKKLIHGWALAGYCLLLFYSLWGCFFFRPKGQTLMQIPQIGKPTFGSFENSPASFSAQRPR